MSSTQDIRDRKTCPQALTLENYNELIKCIFFKEKTGLMGPMNNGAPPDFVGPTSGLKWNSLDYFTL